MHDCNLTLDVTLAFAVGIRFDTLETAVIAADGTAACDPGGPSCL